VKGGAIKKIEGGFMTVLRLIPRKRPVAQGAKKALCIPCAVESDEFKERAPAKSGTPLGANGGGRAWIAGRGYKLFHHPAAKVPCVRCGKEVHVAYVPEEERIA
jgi:hypothetical protein